MSDPTTRALAADRRVNPAPAPAGDGCYVDLTAVPEPERDGLLADIRELISRRSDPTHTRLAAGHVCDGSGRAGGR